MGLKHEIQNQIVGPKPGFGFRVGFRVQGLGLRAKPCAEGYLGFDVGCAEFGAGSRALVTLVYRPLGTKCLKPQAKEKIIK